jgi:ADP-heptose:LPS heptosyltransferase
MKKIEYIFKNLLLKLLIFFSSFRSRPRSNKEVKKILFIRLNKIGDALVTTPLLHMVKSELNCIVYVLADRKNYFVFENNPSIDRVIIHHKSIKGIIDAVKLVSDENIDTIVDLHDDVSTTVSFIVALSKASNKFGLEKENKKIYTGTIPKPDPKSSHVVYRIMEIGKLLGVCPPAREDKNITIHYYPRDEAVKNAEQYIKKRFRENKFMIGVNISAGSKSRFWGVQNFRMLLNFLSDYDVYCLVLCSPSDLYLANEITSRILPGNREIPFFYSPVFDDFASIMSKLNLLFTPDTAAIHLASINRLPVFGIYVQYKTDNIIWSPLNSDFEYVKTNEPTLKNISFNEVLEKFQPFLEKHIK